MDFSFQTSDGGGGTGKPVADEYDPSQPLDSSDDEDLSSGGQGILNFERRSPPPTNAIVTPSPQNTSNHPQQGVTINKDVVVPETHHPSPAAATPFPRPILPPSQSKLSENRVSNLDPDVDLSSIPMPSDEYRRPTIQFSIPTRHRLMSISTLIKRQKGVMRKQDKGGGGLNFNSEVSKAFQKGSGDDPDDSNDGDKPKISLVHEIFGSDDEDQDNLEREEEAGVTESLEGGNITCEEHHDPEEQTPITSSTPLEENNKWKTVAETVIQATNPPALANSRSSSFRHPSPEFESFANNALMTPPSDSQDGIKISIKPSSELLEACGNESSSPDIVTIDEPVEGVTVEESLDTAEDSRGKENKQIVLECVSDTDEDDFEVTFVGIGRANLVDLRQGRLSRRNQPQTNKKSATATDSPPSPCNGFEDGEIVESDKRRRRDKKKKKSKKRKRSKDSRVSSKMNSERSGGESGERKSDSESDGKEVSWRKPKLAAKTRNYRNGKRESEEKSGIDRGDVRNKRDEPLSSSRRRSRSRTPPSRYSSSFSSLKTTKPRRRRRSISSSRHHRSRSKSQSESPLSRRLTNRSRGGTNKRNRREGSYHRSRSFGSHHSSPSHSRSRSITKRKSKRRHSPSPPPSIKRHNRGNRSTSPVSPDRQPNNNSSPSSKPRKRNRSVNGREVEKHDKTGGRASPQNSSSRGENRNRKLSKSEETPPIPSEDVKKKTKVTTGEDTDKEKKKRRKRREKSISPVKAIVADGDSIVVSLSFQQNQKQKDEPSRSSKSSSSSAQHTSNRSNEIEVRGSGSGGGSNNSNNNSTENCDEIEPPLANYKPSTPRGKGTILINLDASPNRDNTKEHKKSSPDGSSSKPEDKCDRDLSIASSKKSLEDKKSHSDHHKSDDEDSESEITLNRVDGRLDFAASSHEMNSVDVVNTHGGVFSNSTPKKTDSPPERVMAANSASRNSPYKFGEFFTASSNSESKSLSPSLDCSSPNKSSAKGNELPDSTPSSFSSKPSRNSPFDNLRSLNSSNSTGSDNNHGSEKRDGVPSPEIIFTPTSSSVSAKLNSTPIMKPMIGNIPGLYPSGFSSSGSISTPSVIIPAPPKIIPNSAPSSLINNLVSVASALYAPLLAANKQPNSGLNSSRHNQSNSLKHGRTNNGDADSPFSPNSSDGDDLFEPPITDGNHVGRDQGMGSNKKNSGDQSHRSVGGGSNAKYGNDSSGGMEKRSLFDSLFAPTSQKSSRHPHGKQKKGSRDSKRGKHKRSSKRTESDKNGDMEMNSRLNEDVPNSAVALKINEKYLKKLNRQERVVEEVKLSLKPHYIKKHITKEEYKDVLRKAVPKICHNKSGEINPNKIKELVEAYVKKYRKFHKGDSKS